MSGVSELMHRMACINNSETNLIKMFETLDKIIDGVPDGLAGDVLKHGEEGFKSQPSVGTINLGN